MRSLAFFTNSGTANTTPPVDLLDISSRTERPRSMPHQPRSGRVRPRSPQSRRDRTVQMPNGGHAITSSPVHDFSLPGLASRLPRSKTTEVRALVANARSEPRLWLAATAASTRTNADLLEPPAPEATLFPSPCAPPRFSPRAHERASAFSILSPVSIPNHPHRCSAARPRAKTSREPTGDPSR